MTTWAVILTVGAGSYLLRSIPVLASGRWSGLRRVEREVAHAGTAALTALVASGLAGGSSSPGGPAATIAALAAGLVVAMRGGSMLRVLVVGAAANAAVVLVLALT